eukprot:944065-Rhodomonas_salina.1
MLPSHYVFTLYNSSLVRFPGLPPGARFREVSAADLATTSGEVSGQRQFEFVWAHDAGGEFVDAWLRPRSHSRETARRPSGPCGAMSPVISSLPLAIT